MNTVKQSVILLFLFGLPIFLGCSTSQNISTETEETVSSNTEKSGLEDLFWTRLQESRMNFVQADVDFMNKMIVHHAQALVMSQIVPDRTTNPQLRLLASRIINAQVDEIATMQQWLSDRKQPVTYVQIDGINLFAWTEQPLDNPDINPSQARFQNMRQHMMHRQLGDNAISVHDDMEGHGSMPGMLTREQLEELADLRDEAFDRRFLELMIEHHEGAVYMVYELFDTDGAAVDVESYMVATEIYADQKTEIETMHKLLEQMAEQSVLSE